MLSKLLVNTFIKDKNNTKDEKTRTSYGLLAGIVGIIINIILFIVKFTVGIVSNSIAVTADAFNNLSDSASSLITIIGFKFSNKPADEEHPFGHGRIEYISAMIVAFMVMLVGFQFVKASFDKIINPQAVNFELIPFILIVLSILTKIWISKFNSYIGKAINSSALKASSLDALGDVVTSSTVALSLLMSRWTSFPIDGYIGILVALFILYSGYKLVKETLNPLLGEAPDGELVNEIKQKVLTYEYISGTHDLIIHNYGPGRCMASIHAEVPADINIVKMHDIIDRAEKEISSALNIYLVIHMDPINVNDDDILLTQNQILNILTKFPIFKSLHDFRVVGEDSHKNLIFDIVVNSSQKLTKQDEESLKQNICSEVKNSYPFYNCIITIDKDFNFL
jgi:cation diffusion facilitator family transporter